MLKDPKVFIDDEEDNDVDDDEGFSIDRSNYDDLLFIYSD